MAGKKDPLGKKRPVAPQVKEPMASKIGEPAAVYDRAYDRAPTPLTPRAPLAQDYRARTPLGARLLEIRRSIETSNTPLLSLDEIDHKIDLGRNAQLHGGG